EAGVEVGADGAGGRAERSPGVDHEEVSVFGEEEVRALPHVPGGLAAAPRGAARRDPRLDAGLLHVPVLVRVHLLEGAGNRLSAHADLAREELVARRPEALGEAPDELRAEARDVRELAPDRVTEGARDGVIELTLLEL